jgi:DNA-binding transcriptional regulator GbsR (MarR family)
MDSFSVPPRALSFDELGERLQISKGSVSQGLKVLRQLGAVKLHYVPGSRRDHYQPELSYETTRAWLY